ncbi:MAG: HTH domain-containing protein [Candidatus Pacearchaeota archaeon]|jgi:DNA-binding MarR family transcriptional regulator
MDDERLKEAFFKVKQDIASLGSEISQIKQEIIQIKQFLDDFSNTTLQHISSTYPVSPTDNPTLPQEIGGLKTPNNDTSIRNEGVPTDRQTHRQTDQQTGFSEQSSLKTPLNNEHNSSESEIEKATKLLDSLDSLKRQIRYKFKHITNQEMFVFSTIYQLEEQNPEAVTYKEIALRLKLSESSIRDYVQRIINKGIPIKKHKINNKQLILSISQDLKRIANLSTIIKLREL